MSCVNQGTYRLVVGDYGDTETGAYDIQLVRVLESNENGTLVNNGVVSGDITVGDIDTFARILYYSGLFLTFLLLTQVGRFAKLQFFLSWWAYSFPIAAITISTLIMFEKTGLAGFQVLAALFLGLLTLIVAYLTYKTGLAVRHRKVCQPET